MRDLGAGPFEQSVRCNVVAGRVALVGDASGYLDALTGVILAFGQAIDLAAAVAKDDLDAYARAHRRRGLQPLAVTRLALLAEAHPGLRRRVVRALAADPELFSRLLAVLDGRHRRRASGRSGHCASSATSFTHERNVARSGFGALVGEAGRAPAIRSRAWRPARPRGTSRGGASPVRQLPSSLLPRRNAGAPPAIDRCSPTSAATKGASGGRGSGPRTPEGLTWLAGLERRVAALPGVDAVAGLAGRHGRDGWPPPSPEAFRDAARGD